MQGSMPHPVGEIDESRLCGRVKEARLAVLLRGHSLTSAVSTPHVYARDHEYPSDYPCKD